MKRAALVFVFVLLPGLATAGQSGSQDSLSMETVGRVVRFLEDSGYQYTKAASSVWTIPFKGANRASIPVLVSATNRQIVIDAVVALHGELGDNAEALRELLRLNASVPNATLVIDEDDDCVARGWYALSDLDSRKFKDALQKVAVAADGAYAGIKRYLPLSGAAAPTPSRPAERPASSSLLPSFATPRSATRRVDILNGKAAILFDPAKWKEKTSEDASRKTFEHTSGDGYAMVIAERIEVAPGQLREIALGNARKAAPDVTIVEEQSRRVNGTDILMLRLDGTMSGIKFTYLGYYYSGAAGTVQVITYTGRNLVAEYRKDFEEFLNGFQVR